MYVCICVPMNLRRARGRTNQSELIKSRSAVVESGVNSRIFPSGLSVSRFCWDSQESDRNYQVEHVTAFFACPLQPAKILSRGG